MINVHYEWNVDLQKLFAPLSTSKQKSSARRALNRATQTMRKIAIKGTTSIYRISASEVRKAISLRYSDSFGEFSVHGKRIGGEKFKFSPGKSGKRHSPLKLSVRKDTPLRPVPRAFIMKRTGSMLRRIAPDRFPLERVNSTSIPQMIAHNDALIEEMKSSAVDTFQKVLAHELKRALGR